MTIDVITGSTGLIGAEAVRRFAAGGKQVRDNIHGVDLVQAFCHFFRTPRVGEVYNVDAIYEELHDRTVRRADDA